MRIRYTAKSRGDMSERAAPSECRERRGNWRRGSSHQSGTYHGGGGGRWGWRRGWGRGSYRGSSHGNPDNGPGRPAAPTQPQARPVQTTVDSRCPYITWPLYLPQEGYSPDSALVAIIESFLTYFKAHIASYNIDDIEMTCSLPLDHHQLQSDPACHCSSVDLNNELRNHPERTLNCIALALHTVIGPELLEQRDDGSTRDSSIRPPACEQSRLSIRLYNMEPVLPLKNLKASQFGKCVTVQGTVVRVSNIRPLVTAMAFKCALCQFTQVLSFPDGKYTPPNKCPERECHSKLFAPQRSSPLTHTIDWQTIRVQELARDDHREAGRIPRTVECELRADLVDFCVPGDMVTITAIVKATGSQEAGRTRATKDKCMFLLYLDAISVTSNRRSGAEASHGLHMEFSTKDYYAIQEIQADSHVFKLIVGSLCPAIFGHEMVKAGLVLGLFGGSQKHTDSLNCIPVRGDPHILIVGDPGLGKSQMLQAAASVAPRGVYVCGNTSTASGLTVTLNREGGSGNYSLEAGALVLADQGSCCIDEFDKMGSQHQSLLEAMEQQSISIAKAGIVCSLPARTSILAAANPVGGHYNKAKTVSENLKMSSALLSRFDLVFILLDKPDPEHDLRLSEHVMSMHSKGQRSRQIEPSAIIATARRHTKNGCVETSLDQSSLLLLGEDQHSLAERLKQTQGEVLDPIPPQLLRKYIGYARKYVHPQLSPDAASVLQTFYLHLRKARQSSDSTPITTRQLEALIRLTEARARLELREVASEQDAQDVVEVMKYSMLDTFSDEFGMVDFQRCPYGSGMSQRSKAKRFIAELNRVAEQTSSSMFTVRQLREVGKRIGVEVPSFDEFIFSLNNQNYILKKGPGLYQLQTASC